MTYDQNAGPAWQLQLQLQLQLRFPLRFPLQDEFELQFRGWLEHDVHVGLRKGFDTT